MDNPTTKNIKGNKLHRILCYLHVFSISDKQSANDENYYPAYNIQ